MRVGAGDSFHGPKEYWGGGVTRLSFLPIYASNASIYLNEPI